MGGALWFAGVDAGGTETKLWLVRSDAGQAGRATVGPGNFQDIGAQGLADRVREGLEEAARDAGLSETPPLAALMLGVAGVGRDRDAQEATAGLEAAFPGTSIQVYNDAIVALAAGTLGDPGAVVIAGTGSTAWAFQEDGGWARTGGWGYILGDEGSGYAVGLSALNRVTKASDGRERPTVLTDRILAELKLDDVWDLIPFVHEGAIPKQKIAGLAPLVMAAAENGDEVAQAVVNEALNELLSLVTTVLSRAQLPPSPPLVVVGGLFKNEVFFNRFCSELEKVQPDLVIVKPLVEPAMGACAMALRSAGRWNEEIRSSLIRLGPA